jgi:hypothetical protein
VAVLRLPRRDPRRSADARAGLQRGGGAAGARLILLLSPARQREMTMIYEQAVAEFRSLDENIEAGQWRQAQITWEQIESGTTQKQWASAVGKGRAHISALYRVWAERQSSGNLGVAVSFADAYRMASTGSDTPEEASAVMNAHRAASSLGKLPSKSRAAIIREHMADPEVAAEVFRDTSARASASRAIADAHEQLQGQVSRDRQERVADGQRPDFEAAEAVRRVVADLDQLVADASRLPGSLGGRARGMLAFSARRAKPTVDWLAALEDGHGVPDDLSSLGGRP